MQAVRPVLRGLVAKNAASVSRTYHGGEHVSSTMNDLPVPQGDWQENYQAKQRKYNGVLIGGIVLFATTIAIAKNSGILHLNYSPPKSLD